MLFSLAFVAAFVSNLIMAVPMGKLGPNPSFNNSLYYDRTYRSENGNALRFAEFANDSGQIVYKVKKTIDSVKSFFTSDIKVFDSKSNVVAAVDQEFFALRSKWTISYPGTDGRPLKAYLSFPALGMGGVLKFPDGTSYKINGDYLRGEYTLENTYDGAIVAMSSKDVGPFANKKQRKLSYDSDEIPPFIMPILSFISDLFPLIMVGRRNILNILTVPPTVFAYLSLLNSKVNPKVALASMASIAADYGFTIAPTRFSAD